MGEGGRRPDEGPSFGKFKYQNLRQRALTRPLALAKLKVRFGAARSGTLSHAFRTGEGYLLNSSRRAKSFVEGVTHAAHRADGIAFAAALQGFAEAPHVHINRALIHIDVAAPHRIKKLGP